MFTDILKIIPKIDNKDLATMEKSLQSRFTKLAKGFGKSLGNVFKGLGGAGIALALVDKFLNPLKEVQEAIDRTLKSSDDIATNANQFNTTSGKLLKLITLSKATGLGQDNLFMLITKFQTAVAEAQADPSKPSAVKNFVGEKDTSVAFFQFIQSLQKLDKNQQLLVQQSVFGEKQILKMADFLQSDFPKLFARLNLNGISTAKLTKDNNFVANLNDRADELQARRELLDVSSKAGVITEGMINARDQSEKILLDKENQRITGYENLAKINDTVERISGLIEEGVSMLGGLIKWITPTVNTLISEIKNIVKTIKTYLGKGD